jgi:NDP-sugar pyrophosphorylase family protein
MIFAAGHGKRLAPITDHVPKPLVPLVNRPILYRTLDRLSAAGVRTFVVNVFHLAERVIEALEGARSRRWGHVHLVREPILLGTGGGLLNARGLLEHERDVLVVNGDIWFDVDLGGLARRHRADGNLATLLVLQRRDRPELHKVVVGEGGRIEAFDGSERPGTLRAVFSGLQVVSRELFGRLPFEGGRPACVVHDGYRALLDTGRVRAFASRGGWADLGTPADLLATTADLLARDLPRHDDVRYEEPQERVWVGRGVAIDTSARLVPPVLLGRGARVGAEAVLGPFTVVGDGAVVDDGTRLARSIVFSGARAAGAHVGAIVVQKHD